MSILKLSKIDYNVGERKILNNINLRIEKGELISIVGKSGSGKSTLLKMIGDLIIASSGDIYFKGSNYEKIEPTELRKKVSYCVQVPILFGEIVKDNFDFVFSVRNEKYNSKIVNRLLHQFDIPKEYLKKKIETLSGGEKQRIALIRNLLFKPEILLLDEVTSALDDINTKIVEKYIKNLNKQGVTIIWITHSNSQSFDIFHKRIVMEQGTIKQIELLEKHNLAI